MIRRNFEDFIAQQQFSCNQIQFLRMVQNVFLKKRLLEVPDLYKARSNRFGEAVIKRWFSEEEVDELIKFTKTLTT